MSMGGQGNPMSRGGVQIPGGGGGFQPGNPMGRSNMQPLQGNFGNPQVMNSLQSLLRGMPQQFQSGGAQPYQVGGMTKPMQAPTNMVNPSMGPAMQGNPLQRGTSTGGGIGYTGGAGPFQSAPGSFGGTPDAMGGNPLQRGTSTGGGIGFAGGQGPYQSAPGSFGGAQDIMRGGMTKPMDVGGMNPLQRGFQNNGMMGSGGNPIGSPMSSGLLGMNPNAPAGQPTAPSFGPSTMPQQAAPQGNNPLAGPNNGTILDQYRTAGTQDGVPLGFTGAMNGRQYVNGQPWAAEYMSQGSDPNKPSFAFQNWLTHYGLG